MNETSLTMAGNLVADPELRYTPTGAVVVNFRIASTERFKGGGGWQDGDTLFMSVTAWARPGRERGRVGGQSACGDRDRAAQAAVL